MPFDMTVLTIPIA